MITVTPELLARIKKISIKEFLSNEYGCSFRGTNCICPHPDHIDKTPSFSVWEDAGGNNYWCCHACHCGKTNFNDHNYGTDIIGLVRFLSDYEGSAHVLTFYEAVEKIAEYANIPYIQKDKESYKEFAMNLVVANSCCEAVLKNPDSAAYKYLVGRGLDVADIKNWMIGYNGARITFPLFNRHKNVLGFSNRRLEASATSPKYINSANSKTFNKSFYLYGTHLITSRCDTLYVTEGQMDVIMGTKYSIPNLVACLGCSFTENHVSYIKDTFPFISKIVFLFDADKAGQKALKRSVELARNAGFATMYCALPEDMDLCDYALENKGFTYTNIMAMSRYYFYAELEAEISNYEATLLNAQSKIIDRAMPILKIIKNPHENQAMNSFLTSRFGIKLGSVEEAKC